VEEWEEKPLSKIGEIITGNTPKTANLDNYGGYRLFVSPADICDERYVCKTKTTLSEQGFKQTRQIKANSILFVCIGSTIGKVAQNKFECATNQQINSIVPFAEYCCDFIYSSLEYSSTKISSLAGNHAVPIINKTLFSSVLIGLPSLPEQQKIADCLSSLDDRITLETQKLDTLKAHKKGLMQQLFPAEGETLPKLRFPEFSEKWREISLGGISDSISSGKDKNDSDGKYDLYGSTGIIGKTLSDTYKGKFLLVARVGANAGFLTMTNGTFGVTDNTLVVCLKKIVNLDFIYYYLESLSLNKLVFGSGQPLITGGQLKALHLFLPDYPEQQKIAGCLTSIDEAIAAQSQAIDLLKLHKKGLMQQLFPSVEEVRR
jgi:type I restriction enzyme S subunit